MFHLCMQFSTNLQQYIVQTVPFLSYLLIFGDGSFPIIPIVEFAKCGHGRKISTCRQKKMFSMGTLRNYTRFVDFKLKWSASVFSIFS